ncbi:major facilitator superfamily domain-containing protein [Aspergillus floccosus]
MSDGIQEQPRQYIAAPGTELLIDQEHLPSVSTYQHITHGDKEILLVPQPSLNDPNDPLLWSRRKKWLTFGNGLLYAFNGAVTGPMMAGGMIQLATFFKRPLSDITYSNGATLICQGLGTLLWMPMAVKFGRRPVYLASNALMGIACVWLAMAAEENYPLFVVARAFLGLFEAPIEAIVPSTVTDIFYLHERGEKIALYGLSVLGGNELGPLASAYIIQSLSMRWAFFITAISIGVSLITMFFFMPETMFNGLRPTIAPVIAEVTNKMYESEDKLSCEHIEGVPSINTASVEQVSSTAKKRSYTNVLFWVGIDHHPHLRYESELERDFGISRRPTICTAVLQYQSTFALHRPYYFASGSQGLVFISPLLGSVAGTYLAGPLADQIATWFTARNQGVREPEMRLPTCIVAAVLTFVGALIAGLTYHYQTHWAGPIVGFGVLSAGAQMGATLAISYSLDCHKELSAEIMVTISCLKSSVAWVWTWCINDWVTSSGLLTVIMSVTAVNVAIYMTTFILHLYGKKIRIWLHKKNFMGEESESE